MSQSALLGKKNRKNKASIFYGADEYIDHLKKKYEDHPELANMASLMPDGGHEDSKHAVKEDHGHGNMLGIHKNEDGRSHKTNRKHPVANKPDPMPEDLAFLFTKLTQEQIMYMWSFLTMIHVLQWIMIILFAVGLRLVFQATRDTDGLCTNNANGACADLYYIVCVCFGIPFAYTAIQNIYCDHDVMHGATFPPYEWQKYITHPFADFYSLPWNEFVLEHNRHHASTVDLLIQGEFGWDPEEYHYMLQQWTDKWYGLMLTVPFIPILHFLGLNDTGGLFSIEWYLHYPEDKSGKCHKDFYNKWLPGRLRHNAVVLSMWAVVYLIGAIPYGFKDAWRFVIPVSISARIGFGLAWMFITNFTHSLPWNRFLTKDPDRTWPCLHRTMAFVLGGRHRWNEMLFHDLHHAFPSAVGTLSQRGRFHGWLKVHDAALEVLHRGLWKPNGDEETLMQREQKKRSQVHKSRKSQSGQ